MLPYFPTSYTQDNFFTDVQWPRTRRYMPFLVFDFRAQPIQVNGKLRSKVEVSVDAQRDVVERLAREQIGEWLQGKEPKKVIYVEKKLMNFVV